MQPRSFSLTLTSTLLTAVLVLGSCAGAPPTGNPPSGMPPGAPPGGGSQTIDHGTAAVTLTSDVSGQTFASTADTQNALRITDGSKVRLYDVTVNKTAGAAGSGDNSNFYGNNAGILVMEKASVAFSNLNVTTTASGSNGLFVYGEGTVVSVDSAKIRTTLDSSGGIMVAGGGSATVKNADIDTEGRSSAALRTDRGGGTLAVDGGTYVSHGLGSPAVYSTANVTVKNATLTATGSEAIVVEGKNSVTLVSATVSGKMVRPDAENIHNVMIYQSMSGDAATGQGEFSMTGGSLTSGAGDMIYVTNTKASIFLSQVKLTLSNPWLLKVVGNDGRTNWGTKGANGGQTTFTADAQTLIGDIQVDSISTLDLTLKNGSVWTGTLNGSGDAGKVAVTLDSSSHWTLSGDSHITSFTGNLNQIDVAGHHLWVAGKVVRG